MRRDFKNSLGSRIHDECIEVLVLIADANAAPNSDKPSVIRQMLRHRQDRVPAACLQRSAPDHAARVGQRHRAAAEHR